MEPGDKDRKRAWHAEQRRAAQAALPLSDAELGDLFSSVEESVESKGCDHSLRFTQRWASSKGHGPEPLFSWLAAHGGHCDCEVAANAQDHWQQNKQ